MTKPDHHILRLEICLALIRIQAEHDATDQELSDALIDVTANYEAARARLEALPQDRQS